MLDLGLPSLDFSSLLQFVLSALALVCGTLLLVRKAASRYFVVDAAFEPGEDYEYRHRMSIGDGDRKPSAGDPVSGSCAVCRRPASKKCSRCKSLRYCSQACQTSHWENHKLNCKPGLSDRVTIVTSSDDACRRRKSLGFSSISLVPSRGTCKVLQEPKKILFPYDEFVKLFNWDKPGFPPCGLLNCGNSCFANVVLQCLASTRPLIAYLLERGHHRGCIRKHEDWCFLCELQVHIQRASESLHPFSPIKILSRLPNIGGNLGYGRQEDAHEFMRFAIDTMQSVCLDEFGGEKNLDPSTQETTLIHYIFGGYLQSQVICTKCNMISNRYENMMDLTVEIQGDAESLEECLDQFTMKEWLDGENMYKCDGCNDYVRAWKRLTIHQAPNILTIALKRFQSGRFGKLNKRVTFPENLDLTPYMSGNGDATDLYTLYAVVVHVDMLNASFFGHYICYTKDYHGRWYRIDDCKVMNVEVEDVLAQGAYMLFYSRRHARREPYIKPTEPARKKQLVADPESSNVSMPRKPISVNCLPSNAGLQSSLLPCEVPIDLPLSGHDRDLSVKSDTMEEVELEDMGLDIPSEIKPIHVPRGLSDVAMDDFEPSSLGPKDLEEGKSSSSWALEDISSAKPMRSNSISPVENPPIEVQMIDIKLTFDPKGIGEMDIDHAEPSWLEPKDVEAGKSGTSRVPADTSSVSPAEISSIAVEAIEVKPKPIPKDSGDVDLNNSDLSSLGPCDLREAKSSISPGEFSSIEVQHMDCREPFVSSDTAFCMEEDSGSISIGEESFKLSKYPPEETFSSERNVHIIAETSSGASIAMPSPVPETSYDSGPNLEQVVTACSRSDSANQIKGLEAVSSANGGTRVQPCWVNGSGGKSKSLFSHGFLDRPARKESVRHKEAIHTGNCGVALKESVRHKEAIHTGNCGVALSPNVNGLSNGHSESELLGKSLSDNEMSLESLSSNGKDNLPGSSEKFISSKYGKQPTIEDKIASTDSVKNDDHPCKSANSDGSPEHDFAKQSVGDNEASLESLSVNGQDTNLSRRSGMSFVSRGFLNKPYRNFKNDDKKIPKKKLGTDANGNDALPESAVSSLPRGFLNKNEDRIAKKELVIITDPPCKTKTSHSNGVAERAFVYQDDDKKYRPVREFNGQGPPGAGFANENGSRWGHNKGAGPTLASDV